MTNQLKNRKKLPQALYIHEDVFADISNQATCYLPHAKRANLLIILLASMGSIGFKGTKGVNKGWRRSPCGGNDGSHYYLWWTKKHPQVNHSSSIFVRAIRHHDSTSEVLDDGDLDKNYILYEYMPNQNEFPDTWTEDQERFIKEKRSIRLLKGTPGTGKTTSLWHAIESDASTKLLYLTWSDQLAETARKYFDVTLAKDAIIDTINLKTFFSRLLDDDVKETELKYFDLKKAIREFKDLVEKKIKDHQLKNEVIKNAELYYGLIRAWILGRAPWEGLRATQFSFTNQSASELKSTNELKSSNLEQKVIANAKHDQLFKIFENEADEIQNQKVLLYTEWDEVLKERLKDAREIYQKLNLTEQEEIKLFPELSLAKRSLEKLQKQEKIPIDLCYERIVIDEVQDLTPIEIAVIICLCQRLSIEHHVYPHILIAGDEGQIVRPTYFEWRELSLLLYHSLSKPFAITLQKNLRSPKLIVDLLEQFKRLYELKLPKRLHASGQVAPQSDLNTECLLALTVYQDKKDLMFFLEKMASNPDVMIISLSDQIPSDLMDRTDILERIKTPTEVKGLEYATICLLNLSSTLLSLSEELAEKDPLAYFLALNQLRVAFSRATQNLIIVEFEDHLSLSAVRELLFNGKELPELLSFEIAPEDLKQAIFASQTAILDYLMLDDQSIDEKIAGFLREVGRELNHRPQTAWRLLHKADQLMLEHAFEDDGFQKEITIYQIRIAIFHAFDKEWVAVDQKEILSVLQAKLKNFGLNGTKIENLILQLFKWQSNEKKPFDLIEVFKIFISFDFEENLSWFKHDFVKYRDVLIKALTDLATHTDHAALFDQDISRWLRAIGFTKDEAQNQARKLKRKAFDDLISAQKSIEANFIWLSEFSNSEEIEDLKRKATYLDQVKRFDEAGLIWERCSEKAKAFVSYQNAGNLKDAMRLADSMEYKEKSEIERWRFILSLLETPLSDIEKNLILTQCSVSIEKQNNDYQIKRNEYLNQIKQLENDFIQKNQMLSNELEDVQHQALIVLQKKEEIEKLQVEVNGIKIALEKEKNNHEEIVKLKEQELMLRKEEIELAQLQIDKDRLINEQDRLANKKEREDLEKAKAELKKKPEAKAKIISKPEALVQSAKIESKVESAMVQAVVEQASVAPVVEEPKAFSIAVETHQPSAPKKLSQKNAVVKGLVPLDQLSEAFRPKPKI